MFTTCKNIVKSVAGIFVMTAGCAFIFAGCSKPATPESEGTSGAAGVGAPASQTGAVAKYGSDTLRIYMPDEYMSEDLIPNFEKQFGVKVEVKHFDSNEDMYKTLMAGESFDLLIPSDYMIERLIRQKVLQPLDKNVITNVNQLSDSVKNLSFDPSNTYSIPYFWGNVGIVYNKTKIDDETVKKDGYAIFLDTKYAGHIYWYDSERDSFMVALKSLGFSMNTADTAELTKAYTWLVKMSDSMSPEYVTDEVIDGMKNGTKDIALVYSGDAASILDENKDMSFYAPSEGTNVWYDAMVIPINAKAPKLANEFINYTLSHDAAFKNSDAVGYASVNADVLKEMTADGGNYATNIAYLPRNSYEKDEIFHDSEAMQFVTADLWARLRGTDEEDDE